MSSATYVPLWCKSNYSFLEGASHPEELVEQAHLLGLPALALTDRHGLYGVVRAQQRLEAFPGPRLLCGAQVLVGEGSENTSLLLLVQNREGWQRLCRLLTLGAHGRPKGENLIPWEAMLTAASLGEGLLALWGGTESSLVADDEDLWRRHGELLRESFGDRIYAVLPRHRLAAECYLEPRVRLRAHRLGLAEVAAPEVLYHQAGRRRLQDVLTCIRHRTTLAQAGRLLRPNSCFSLLTSEEALELYGDRPEALRRTFEVAERCHFELGELHYRYPNEEGSDGISSVQRLTDLAWQGAVERYGEPLPQEVERLLQHELSVILKLEYVGYFLTMLEIVNFCRSQGILCQGRGSAANSVVCFCLGITAVDPVKLGLLFERFVSEERAEPPDIDLDIAHQRREEVIAWVYQRYGRERAAMVANVVRYRPRSAVREIGKVLGVEVPVIERLARLLSGFSPSLELSIMHLAGLDPERQRLYGLLWELVNEILDFPRHLSIHPGGFLLGRDPVCELVPIEHATMDGRTVIQWDKYDVEALGLFKVDLLGLGALSQIDRAFRLIAAHWGEKLSMESIPVDDQATYGMLSEGDSVGIFQVESRAQMAMLPSMQPRRFYDLVIQVAIVRPGPITGGMVHPYLRRRVGQEEVDYPHPSLKPVLEKTLGVPLFQEQVMKLAMVAADYTPGEADLLRRDMATWRSQGKLERHRERLLSRMIAKGIEPDFAERVFAQIKGFGEYGFPESHAASFALITYVASFLRCHYPEAFLCALLNSLPMGFYSASTLLEDARRQGVRVLPFCAEKSFWECTLESLSPAPAEQGQQLELFSERNSTKPAELSERKSFGVRLGLKFLKGMSQQQAERIVSHRPFRSTRELVCRAGLDRKALELLASGGALAVYGRSRRQELWATEDHLAAKLRPLLREFESSERDFAPLDENGAVLWDYQAAGLSARGHPMQILRPALRRAGFPDAATLKALPEGRWTRYAAMVICRQRPATANGTVFMTLEDETGLVNVIVWSKVFEDHYVVARSAGLLGVKGRIQRGKGVVHLVASTLYRPDLDSKVEVGSRNFH